MTELTDYGFFDYLSPHFGGLEAFRLDDWLRLLDDMAEAGMNSLNIGIRGQTTGWRSRLPYLDQLPGCPNIESDNQLVRRAMAEARSRGIAVWFTVCVGLHVVERFGGTPARTTDRFAEIKLPFVLGYYDSDAPGVADRAVEMCRELVDLFPGLDGLVIEAENMDLETPHRVPMYNEWAAENGRRPFDALGHPMRTKAMDVPEWRDYTTWSKARMFRAIESGVREKGFAGRFATICEVGSRQAPYYLCQAVNIADLVRLCPGWEVVTYQYEKWSHRRSLAEFCLQRPKADGAKVIYLPRGLLTIGYGPGATDGGPGRWPLPISLQDHWRMDVEDIEQFRPDGVWWFGMGSVGEGLHISLRRLRQAGFRDGDDARRVLLRIAASLHARKPARAG